jgi:hypothetical protein
MFSRRKRSNPLEDAGDYAPSAAEIVPFQAQGHERVVPIRAADLERFIINDPDLAPSDKLLWERLCRLLSAVFHHEYHSWLASLKDLYAPIDPDSECVSIARGSRALTETADEAFLQPFESAMIRANYQVLEMAELRRAIEAPNERGLNYMPDFELFEHLRVYARGRTRVERSIRNIGTHFRRKTIELEAFQRLVVALKFRATKDLGPFARTDVVYLRLFKDVPFVDMEMHLPEQGTKVRMRAIDKAQIASPLLVGLPTLALKLLKMTLLSPLGWTGLLIAPVSAGVNSFFGFQRAKQKHLHHMIRNLYYLTLANNASVLSCIIDSAEEEDRKEALLAFYVLWKRRDSTWGVNKEQLDEAVEKLLTEQTGAEVDFEVVDALGKLLRLGLVTRGTDGTLRPISLEEALIVLDEQWDNQFRYSNPSSNTGQEKSLTSV